MCEVSELESTNASQAILISKLQTKNKLLKQTISLKNSQNGGSSRYRIAEETPEKNDSPQKVAMIQLETEMA